MKQTMVERKVRAELFLKARIPLKKSIFYSSDNKEPQVSEAEVLI